MFKFVVILVIAVAAVQAKYPGEEEVLKEMDEIKEYTKSVIISVSDAMNRLVDEEAKTAEERGGAKSYTCAKILGQAYVSKMNGILFADYGALGYYCFENEQKIKEGKLSLEEFNEVVSNLKIASNKASDTMLDAMTKMDEFNKEFKKTAKAC